MQRTDRGIRPWIFTVAFATAVFAALTGGCGKRNDDAPNQKTVSIPTTSSHPDPHDRALAAARAAQGFIKSKDTTSASQCFGVAVKALDEITDPAKKVEAYVEVATAQLAAGRQGDARRSGEAGEKALEQIADADRKLELGSRLAQSLAKAGSSSAGQRVVKSLEPLATQGSSAADRVSALGQIAVAYHSLNMPTDVKRVLDLAQKDAQSASEPAGQVQALTALADAQFKCQQHAAAEKSLADAEQTAAKITAHYSRAHFYCEIAKGYWSQNKKDKARAVLKRAKEAADAERDPSFSSEIKGEVQNLIGKYL